MPTLNPEIIREYDIRGVADRDFSDGTCYLLGRAIGAFQQRAGKHRITLGRDCRLHSERIGGAVLRGLLESGLEVADIGMCATPLLYFSVNHWDMDGGVMVTASHNPPEDNGLKICVGQSTISGPDLRKIGEMVEARDFVAPAVGHVSRRPVLDEYVDYVTAQIRAPRKLRVAIDAGNGPGGVPSVPIFRRLGHEVIVPTPSPTAGFPTTIRTPPSWTTCSR